MLLPPLSWTVLNLSRRTDVEHALPLSPVTLIMLVTPWSYQCDIRFFLKVLLTYLRISVGLVTSVSLSLSLGRTPKCLLNTNMVLWLGGGSSENFTDLFWRQGDLLRQQAAHWRIETPHVSLQNYIYSIALCSMCTGYCWCDSVSLCVFPVLIVILLMQVLGWLWI